MSYALIHAYDKENDQWDRLTHSQRIAQAGITTTTTLVLDMSDQPLSAFSVFAIGATGFTSATVKLEISYDNTNWSTIATISLSGTTLGSAHDAGKPALYVRANVSAIVPGSGSLTVGLLAAP